MTKFRKVVRVKISGMDDVIWITRTNKDPEVLFEVEDCGCYFDVPSVRRLIAAFQWAIKKQPKKRGNK